MKYLLAIASMLVYSLCGIAVPRSVQQARQIAESFVGSAISINKGVHHVRTRIGANGSISPISSSADSTDEMGTSPYYIFNIDDNKGFVIISADDQFKDILGYCPAGAFDEDNLPDGLRYWLESLEAEMKANSNSLTSMSSASDTSRVTSMADYQTSISPLITTTWDQGVPYNSQIPVAGTIYSNGKASTGCVSTAMAQIMNYWHCPTDYATGRHRNENYYDSFVFFGFVKYNWDLLIDHYGKYIVNGSTSEEYNQEYTQEQADEVAKLMYHCGVVTDTKWGDSSSASNTSAMYALMTYFGFNKYMHAEARNVYSPREFRDMLLNELNNGRPMLYWAKNASGMGHYFICDGFDNETGLFHFNWGWSGFCDGYYALSALNPQSPEGKGSGFGTFDYQQFVCIDCQPETEGSYTPMFTANEMTLGSAKYGAAVSITSTNLTNSSVNYDEKLGIALIQDEEIKYSNIDKSLELKPSDFFSSVTMTSPKLGSSIKSGEYTLCVIAQSSNGDYMIVKANYGTPYMWKVVINTSAKTLSITPVIIEDNTPDAISSVEIGDLTVKNTEYHTLSGAKVKAPTSGIYIKRTIYSDGSSKVSKIYK